MTARAKEAQGAKEAKRHRERRAMRRALGRPVARGGRAASLFDCGQFVAIDGEGFNEGPSLTFDVGKKQYAAREHFYAYLAASDGAELYNPTGRLGTQQCLDFLIDRAAANDHAILVTFGASYDMCQMLMHGLTRDQLDELMHGDGSAFGRKVLDVTLGGSDYRIECRMRKQLSVSRWPAGQDKYEQYRKKSGGRAWRLTKHDRATLWDVWGFFQGSYVGALQRWLPDDPDTAAIAAMKAKRSTFDRAEIDVIREYTAKENRTLVAIMGKLRASIAGIGLKLTRWDGAGAVASAMFRENGVKDHMQASPPAVFDAARVAYSGGHIEMMQIGHHNRTLHHYDISSAYPHWFRLLPSLKGGTWTHGTGRPREGFTLVRVQYRFQPGAPFYPLFYREQSGAILYPERGAGWYWYPEYDAARQFADRFGAIAFDVAEWWHFQPHENARPFAWIETYFDQRTRLIDEADRAGLPRPGEEYSLRLGINACYGKTAQQVGVQWKDGELCPPAHFQIEWAGYVTAGCRSQVMLAAMQQPDAIVAVATDGLFSTVPLDVACPPKKTLGTWEYTQHAGITAVMPGVYWLHDVATRKNPAGLTVHSRGFKLSDMGDVDRIHRAWRDRALSIDVTCVRFITAGTALSSDTFWKMRGMFVDGVRSLALNGSNSKRGPITLREQPHRWLVATRPRDIREDYDAPLSGLGSEPYPIDWLDNPPDADLPGDEDGNFDEDALAAFLV